MYVCRKTLVRSVMLLGAGVACGQLRQPASDPTVARAAIESESAEWYRTATLRRSARSRGQDSVTVCHIVARDSTVAIGYTCNVVLLSLRPASSLQPINALLNDISGTVGRVFSGRYIFAVEIHVPVGTELAAIRRAYGDSNVVRASLGLERIAAF